MKAYACSAAWAASHGHVERARRSSRAASQWNASSAQWAAAAAPSPAKRARRGPPRTPGEVVGARRAGGPRRRPPGAGRGETRIRPRSPPADVGHRAAGCPPPRAAIPRGWPRSGPPPRPGAHARPADPATAATPMTAWAVSGTAAIRARRISRSVGGRRCRAAGLATGDQQLLDEERVAIGTSVDPIDEIPWWLRPEDGRQQLARLSGPETLQDRAVPSGRPARARPTRAGAGVVDAVRRIGRSGRARTRSERRLRTRKAIVSRVAGSAQWRSSMTIRTGVVTASR